MEAKLVGLKIIFGTFAKSSSFKKKLFKILHIKTFTQLVNLL